MIRFVVISFVFHQQSAKCDRAADKEHISADYYKKHRKEEIPDNFNARLCCDGDIISDSKQYQAD